MIRTVLAVLFLAASLGATTAQTPEAERATVLILDASGSMWGQLDDGRTKIEVARDVLSGFLASRDMSVPLGVIAYGHNRKGDCSDIEVIAPVGGQGAAALSGRLGRINPKGKTPLGRSLRKAAGAIPRTAEEADIVLVTDGLETCGLDPCAVADELAAQGIRIRAHVVGFGLTEAEAQALACVPDRTGGLLLRPQTGAELSEALSRATAKAPPAAMTGARLIFSYPGAMPESYEWRLRNSETGEDRALGTVTGEARYQPFALELAPGRYTAIVTAKAGRGEADFAATGEGQDIVVTLQGALPVTAIRDRGPYAARGETVTIDAVITQAGQETGGAALSLRLFPADGGEAITYSTVDGEAGAKWAGINLPDRPGRYLLRLETWGGEVLEEMMIVAERDPAVTLVAPPAVAPGQPIAVESTGSQLSSDRIEIWQDETRIDWGLTLGDFASGSQLRAPAEPGIYDLVYRGYDSGGNDVDKARVSIEVGTVTDDATGEDALRRKAEADMGHGPDGGSDEGIAWEDYPYHCLGGDNCEVQDEATGLSFFLPKGWVATSPSVTPMTAGPAAAGVRNPLPNVEFYQAGGDLNAMVLNPHQWIEANGRCVVTRAGPLCLMRNDAAPDDAAAAKAVGILQHTLTTGRVIRRCGAAPCDFAHPNPAIAGRMPSLWSVEAARVLPDGRLATWYFDRDRGGNFKLIGLNQQGGDGCLEAAPGQLLCEFTPYISTEEFELIRSSLTVGPVRQAAPLTSDDIENLLDRLAPSRQPAE
ncbi:VWA domain-containing protein [Microbaculum sp. FT89]|uniref:VWA domain-containing protein n=1 Tax=Microbaculum sp. FT89 TaxID=3447298 RepID=UPI003F5335E2